MENLKIGVINAALLLFLCHNLTLAQPPESCGSIGSRDETAVTPSRAQMFYLNTADPAPCTGNITNWRVCYYGPESITSAGSYWATYAVYRRVGSGSNVIRYVRVSEMFRAIRTIERFTRDPVVDGEIAEGGFNCYTDSIDIGALPLTIQAGDILGACVFDPEGDIQFGSANILVRLPLDVIGEVSSGSLLQMDTAGCSMEDIPSDIPEDQLSTLFSRRLHIYANIEMLLAESTTTASLPPKTTTHTSESPLTSASNTESESSSPTTSTISTTNPLLTALSMTTTSDHDLSSGPATMESATIVIRESVPMSNITGAGVLPINLIVSITIGLLVLLIVPGVVIVVVLFCLFKHRQVDPGGKYSTRRATSEKVYVVDNVTYEAGMTEHGQNAGVYEEPLSAHDSSRWTEHEYSHELMGTVPSMYEYATKGPNEQTIANYEHKYFALEEAALLYTKLLEKNKQEDIYGNVEEYLQPATEESELYAQIKACGIKNIPSTCIQIKRHLGSGQFGSVEEGVWRNKATSCRDIKVAVKLLQEGASKTDKVKFLQEAAIMAQFTHPNVVSLYGVVSKTEPLMLVVELIDKGDLRNHLHTMRPDPGELPKANILELLLNYSQQVALGMHYLSAKGFVHRDLAARNILVSKDNICKVADFGMSRDLADDKYYVSHGGIIPIKWTAPEAIHYKKYSTASDVWSYGCLLYETWSLGCKPFEGFGNAKMIELVDSGKRLSPPPGCSRVIYELMIKCWNPEAAQRPSFRELMLMLLDNPKVVLFIPPEALGTNDLAGVLGSPLEAGENMYQDLQERYMAY